MGYRQVLAPCHLAPDLHSCLLQVFSPNDLAQLWEEYPETKSLGIKKLRQKLKGRGFVEVTDHKVRTAKNQLERAKVHYAYNHHTNTV